MAEKPRQIEEPVQEQEPVTIREIRTEDCDDMVGIWNSLVEEKAPIARQTPKTREQQLASLAEIIKGVEKGEAIYDVAEKDGHVVGFASISGCKEKEGVRTATLGVIALIKELRGMGLADNLLEDVISKAKEKFGLDAVDLETFDFNEQAKKLYARHGFEKTDKKCEPKEYYGKMCDRIEMIKNLK